MCATTQMCTKTYTQTQGELSTKSSDLSVLWGGEKWNKASFFLMQLEAAAPCHLLGEGHASACELLPQPKLIIFSAL